MGANTTFVVLFFVVGGVIVLIGAAHYLYQAGYKKGHLDRLTYKADIFMLGRRVGWSDYHQEVTEHLRTFTGDMSPEMKETVESIMKEVTSLEFPFGD